MLLHWIYFQIVIRNEDNILFRLEIPVDDAVLMQMTESQRQLCQVELHIFFSKHHLHDICTCYTYSIIHSTVSHIFQLQIHSNLQQQANTHAQSATVTRTTGFHKIVYFSWHYPGYSHFLSLSTSCTCQKYPQVNLTTLALMTRSSATAGRAHI